jgi:hypothetical protein
MSAAKKALGSREKVRGLLAVLFTAAATFTGIGEIVFATARQRIVITAPRRRCVYASIDTSRRQAAAMNCFGEDSRNLLGKGAMLRCGATTEGLFQFIGHISTDEHAFTIDHFFGGSL